MNSYSLHADLDIITFVSNWLYGVKQAEVRDSTLDRLRVSMEALENYELSHIKVADLAISDFQTYVQQLISAGYAHTTIKKQMRIVSAPIQYAYINKIIDFNPCAAVKIPSALNAQKQARDVVAYTPEQQEALMREAHKESLVPHLLVEFMMVTGVRVGEAMALKWHDVYTESRRMRIHSTVVNLRNGKASYAREGAKSKSSNRTIPLSVRACEILNHLRSFSTSEFVFADETGKPITYESLRYHTQRLCKGANVPYYGLHVWRHTFATNQYYKGTDVKILSKLLGHADASITYNVYIHLYGDGFDDMLKAVD